MAKQIHVRSLWQFNQMLIPDMVWCVQINLCMALKAFYTAWNWLLNHYGSKRDSIIGTSNISVILLKRNIPYHIWICITKAWKVFISFKKLIYHQSVAGSIPFFYNGISLRNNSLTLFLFFVLFDQITGKWLLLPRPPLTKVHSHTVRSEVRYRNKIDMRGKDIFCSFENRLGNW